jgi:hypothetical protein
MKFLCKQTTTRLITTLILVVGILSCSHYVFAQERSDAGTINLRPSTQFYEPNSQVEIEVVSRLINLNNKQITWSVNGDVVEDGFGVKSITVPTGTLTDPTTVSFVADLPEEGRVTRKLTLQPVEVDLVWEADQSYTPPFFQGKSLNPGWGNISVTAIPHIYKSDGTKYPEGDLVYRWEYNGVVYGDDSGRGQNSITVNTTPRNNRLSVEIEAPNGEIVARDFVNIPRSDPQIKFYRQLSNRGTVLSKSLEDSVELDRRDETRITAQPYYYLSESSRGGNLNYNWMINGEQANQNLKDSIVLGEGNQNDSYNLSLEVTDSSNLLFPATQENLQVRF